jgi:hypothetical protein
MENQSFASQNVQLNNSYYEPKNVVIMVLVVLLLLSFLGINILDIFSNIIKIFVRLFGPIVNQILSLLGYTTGSVLNVSADVIGDTSKAAIDIAEGTVQNVGNLLIKASKTNIDKNTKTQLDNVLSNSSTQTTNNVEQDIPENPIQNPISSSKNSWCYIGEYEKKRSCIAMNEHDKCMSGQVFPEQQICLNPTNQQ